MLFFEVYLHGLSLIHFNILGEISRDREDPNGKFSVAERESFPFIERH